MRSARLCTRIAAGRHRAGGQSGFALVELLICASLMAVVLAAILSVLDATQRASGSDFERAEQLKEAETGVYAMTRELRQTYQVVATAPYSFEGYVYEGGQSVHVKYDCSGTSSLNPSWGQCIRNVIGGSSPGSQIEIPSFTNTSATGGTPIFTYTTNAGVVTYVAVRVEVPAQGALKQGYSYRITYDDGFYMRNVG